jgi:hypothetical protein
MHLFEVHEFIAEDDKVVATGKYEFRSTRTGEYAVSEWIVIFHFENEEPRSAQMYYCITTLPMLKKHFYKNFSVHSIDNYRLICK